jgi:lipoprotein-releasing system permease protein
LKKRYISFNGKGDIAYLRGVDSAYTKVNPINKDVLELIQASNIPMKF